MAAHGLRRDELIYELKLRNVQDLECKTMRQLRDTLNQLFTSEPGLDFPGVILDIENEMETCRHKVDALSLLVTSFDGNIHSAEYDELDHRILHLLNRTRRLVNRARPELEAEIQELHAAVIELDEKLNSFPSAPVNSTPISISMPPNTIVSSSTQPVVDRKIYKWGIKFSGDEPHQSVADVIDRIEELRVARRVSKTEMFQSVVDILDGSALCWFRAMRSSITSWDDLVVKLKLEFQPIDYMDDLWDEILHRLQGPDERVNIYIASMENLFSRLSTPVPELQRLHTIRRNLTPYLLEHLGTKDIESIDELMRVCKRLEENRFRAARNANSQLRADKPVEPAYAYRPSVTYNHSQCPRSKETNAAVFLNLSCWNCNQKGHLFRQCTQTLKRFCRRCGYSNVTSFNCPRCTSSGNDAGRE